MLKNKAVYILEICTEMHISLADATEQEEGMDRTGSG